MKYWTFLILSCYVLSLTAYSQKGYSIGEVVTNFPIKKILNASTKATKFDNLKKQLTVIDFFGTWCVPCIRALPHLSALQQKYKDQIQILLVSIEEETKLQQFINKRQNFSFPVAVDADNSISNLFQPPSYPYSVVLNKQGQIVATVSEASSINDKVIEQWLSKSSEDTLLSKLPPPKVTKTHMLRKSTNPIVQLSQDFLYAAKTEETIAPFEAQLKTLDLTNLEQALATDNSKKAFWINLYNAYTNTILKKSPEMYQNRRRFFSSKQIAVANQRFSLDDIEHDILRRSKVKWALGYLSKWFPSKRDKQLRVNEVDYRIHFALNCGARSCPPIAYYSPEHLDQQLELATKNYLSNEVELDSVNNIIRLPAIISWFRGDFGGKRGMRAVLKKHGFIVGDANPRIKFKPYDWTLELNNYKTENE